MGAPVMRDQPDPTQAQDVHEREDVGSPAGRVIAARRRLRPAEAAPVRADQPVLPGQQGDDMPPGVPVLQEAVQQHDRIATTRLGNVHADAPD